MNLCLIENCQSSVHSRGLCGSHYTKLSKNGQLESTALPSKNSSNAANHRLTNRDEEKKIADCAVCGSGVPIAYRKTRNHWVCRVKRLEGQKHFIKTQSPIVFNKFEEVSDGLCGICNKMPATDLDHCHTSGVIRGMLCRGCNIGLGYFSDDVTTLLAAIAYLSTK